MTTATDRRYRSTADQADVAEFSGRFGASHDLTDDGYGNPIDESGIGDDLSLDPATHARGFRIEDIADGTGEHPDPEREDLLDFLHDLVETRGYGAFVAMRAHAHASGPIGPIKRDALPKAKPENQRRRPSLAELRVSLCRPAQAKPGMSRIVVQERTSAPAMIPSDCRQAGCKAKTLTGRGYCSAHGGEARFKAERTQGARTAVVPMPIRPRGPGSLRMASRERRQQFARR